MGQGRGADRRARWLKLVAHAGYAARGVVYLLVGVLAFLAAFAGGAGQTTGTHGALRRILGVPGGDYLLGAVAAGLVAYALWRFIQGVFDADGHGKDGRALIVRSGLLVSGVTHLFLAFFALSIILGWGSGGGGSSDWTARLMAEAYGRWLVGGIGALITGAGLVQLIKGYNAGFLKHLEMLPSMRGCAVPTCRVGLMARGLVFCMIGAFVIIAAWQQDPSEAKGLGGALSALQDQPYGQWLLRVVAAGLVAFSIYSFIEAGYRRVGPPRPVKQVTPGL